MMLAALFSLTLISAPRAEQLNWRMYGILPTTHQYSKAMIACFKRIEEKSQGRLKITFHYFGETPYKVNDALNILRDGLVEMAEWLPSYTAGTYPILSAPELPFLNARFEDAAGAQAAANAAWSTPVVRGALDKLLAQHRSVALARYYFEPMNFWLTTPVKTSEDLKGKKIRIFTPELAELVAQLGASPVTIATTEQYTALQRGVLNGTITGSGNLAGAKLIEVIKGGLIANFMMTSARTLVSQRALDKLPPDLKQLLTTETAALETELLTAMPKRDADNQADGIAAGMTIARVSPEDYARIRKLAVDNVWTKWKASVGDEGATALDQILATQTAGK